MSDENYNDEQQQVEETPTIGDFMARTSAALDSIRNHEVEYFQARDMHDDAQRRLAELKEQNRDRDRSEIARLKERHEQELAELGRELDANPIEGLREAEQEVADTRETHNLALDSWRESIDEAQKSKTLTRSQMEMAGLTLPNRTHRRI